MTEECSNHDPFLSNLRPNGLSYSKMNWWAIYRSVPVNGTVRLPQLRRGDSKRQEPDFSPSAEKQTRNYDRRVLNHHPFLSTFRSNGLSHSKTKWWAIYRSLPVNATVRLPHPPIGDSHCQDTFLAPSDDKETWNYDREVPKLRWLPINTKVKGSDP